MDAASEASKGNKLAAFVYGTGRTADDKFKELVGDDLSDLNKRLSDGELSEDDKKKLSEKANDLIASGGEAGKRLGELLKKRVTENTSSGEANAAIVATADKTEKIADATKKLSDSVEKLTGFADSMNSSLNTIKEAYA
jgi:hypothetical protein